MPEYRRWHVPGGTYFFTVALLNRRLKLLVEHVDLLREAFQQVHADHPFHIDAIVILPEHLHCLMTMPRGDDDYSLRWQRIKGRFSSRLPKREAVSRSRVRKRERGIWQRRFWEHVIVDEADFTAHVDYIHFNPVKHGHVKRPIDWPHSSMRNFVERGLLNPAWSATPTASDFMGEHDGPRIAVDPDTLWESGKPQARY